MRCVYLIGIAMALTACEAETHLQGQTIRRVSPDEATNCQFLGPVPGTVILGQTTAPNTTDALLKVQSDVVARGGNAFVLTYWDSNSDGATAQADAYFCPESGGPRDMT